jgi:hypothetical protein
MDILHECIQPHFQTDSALSVIATCKVAYGQFSISEVDDISVFSPYLLIYDVGHSHKGYCRGAAC